MPVLFISPQRAWSAFEALVSQVFEDSFNAWCLSGDRLPDGRSHPHDLRSDIPPGQHLFKFHEQIMPRPSVQAASRPSARSGIGFRSR
jgi:hypothetical protein